MDNKCGKEPWYWKKGIHYYMVERCIFHRKVSEGVLLLAKEELEVIGGLVL